MRERGTESPRSVSSTPRRLGRSKYHTVCKHSEVDGNLFEKPPAKTPRPQEPQHHTTKRTPASAASTPRDSMPAVLLTRRDLERMKVPTGLLTPRQLAKQQQAALEEAENQVAMANARNSRMVELELQRKAKEPLTEEQVQQRAEAAARTARGRVQMEENMDAVKRMSQLATVAQCAAVREQQLEEKRRRAQQDRSKQLALDCAVEADRIAALRLQEAQEVQRRQEHRRGASLIRGQLAEREEQRHQQHESLLLEGKRMQQQAAAAEAADRAAAAAKLEAARDLMASVVAGNATLAKHKHQQQEIEAQQDRQILAYQLHKDKQEQEAAEARTAAALAREMEVAKLRAKQTKLADRRSEMDELRARRWNEAAERDQRNKAADGKARQVAVQEEIAAARFAQASQRVTAAAAQAAVEMQEHARVANELRAATLANQLEEEARAKSGREHAALLRQQVQQHDEQRRAQASVKAAEGAAHRHKLEQDHAVIEAAKQRKLAQLQAQGVPAKFCSDLVRFKT